MPISVPNTPPNQVLPVTNSSVSATVRSTTCAKIKINRQEYTMRRIAGFDGTKP
jgi:hypothetical protein